MRVETLKPKSLQVPELATLIEKYRPTGNFSGSFRRLELGGGWREDNIPTWIDGIEAEDLALGIRTRDSPWRVYLSSFYFCSYTLTSVGYGDIGPANILERFVCCVVILSAGLAWAYVIGEVAAIVHDLTAESHVFRKRMHHLNLMMRDQGLPHDLCCRLRSFFLQNRHQSLVMARQALLERMSPQLQSEVCIATNFAWLQKVHFFKKFMNFIRKQERLGMHTEPYQACVAHISKMLSFGAFAQREAFTNVQAPRSQRVAFARDRGFLLCSLAGRERCLHCITARCFTSCPRA